MSAPGYFAIGIYHPKNELNVGTLWRTARIFGAAFIFTVGHRYKPQSSDTTFAPRYIPLLHFPTVEALRDSVGGTKPGCALIGVELDKRAVPLAALNHPKQAVYLLGAEDHGLPPEVLAQCQKVVQLPGDISLNVAVAGSIVLYDRLTRPVRGTVVEAA